MFFWDKQRYEDNLSPTLHHMFSEEEDIEQQSLQVGGKLLNRVLHCEDPQSLYNKAVVQRLKVDLKMPFWIYSMISSLFKKIIPGLRGLFSNNFTREIERLDIDIVAFLPINQFDIVELASKLIDNNCSSFEEAVTAQFFPGYEAADNELFPDLLQSLYPLIQCVKDTLGPFCMKSGIVGLLLNTEEFWQFLKKQAITLEELLAKTGGSFLVFDVVLSKLNAGHFTKFLKSVGVHSLKLSDEQFLDVYRNNILMYCVRKTTHFCIVAEWARKQDCLDEMLSQRNCDGETCFVLACKHDNFGLVKVLLQKYHYDWLRDGFNAISVLCENGNVLIFKHLLSSLKGENVRMMLDSMRGSRGENILMITTFNSKTMETFLNFLIEEKLFDRMLYEKDASGFSCLFWAASYENIESIKMLIERHKYNWRTDRNNRGNTIAHALCSLETPDVLKFFVANYGCEFIKVAQELDYAGCSCLEIACFVGRSVEVVQIVLNSLNDSFPLPQNFTQLLRCLIAANEENGENKNKILDCLVSHMLQKLSFGYHEDKIKQHYLVYALDPEDMHEIGARILTGPKELGEADSGEPETFSLGSWQCIFWAVTEHKELRILTNQPVCKMSAILARSEGSCINIFASWEYLGFLMYKIADQRLPESCTSTCFRSWDELFDIEFTGLEKDITWKCCNENSHNELVSLLEDIDLD